MTEARCIRCGAQSGLQLLCRTCYGHLQREGLTQIDRIAERMRAYEAARENERVGWAFGLVCAIMGALALFAWFMR